MWSKTCIACDEKYNLSYKKKMGRKGIPLLVVDDDPDVLEVVNVLLTEEGYRVTTATNGVEAMALLEAGIVPAVILLDLRMPKMNGWEVIERLGERTLWRKLPVIVLSAERYSGALPYLQKPFGARELLRMVEEHAQLERRSARRESVSNVATIRLDGIESDVQVI